MRVAQRVGRQLALRAVQQEKHGRRQAGGPEGFEPPGERVGPGGVRGLEQQRLERGQGVVGRRCCGRGIGRRRGRSGGGQDGPEQQRHPEAGDEPSGGTAPHGVGPALRGAQLQPWRAFMRGFFLLMT